MSIIKVEGLGKSYTISHEERERYTALRDVIARKTKKMFSFNKSTNKQIHGSTKEEFWALKDINFEVQQGDRIGIIGRNGAGKSTLLKILSRITEPTAGSIKIKGRVASLLEVGTGFHPELTGAENIYLNGAILGMSRAEVKKKFDEIVAFAEMEKFLDTPVKRYSSGMYVRLAFAVAAHLEPEILVVDEVLAVGDAEFQKKCLGKMEDVSKNEGRTVLFVSHNMSAIINLCSSAILLDEGEIILNGNVNNVVQKYNSKIDRTSFSNTYKNKPTITKVELDNAELNNGNLLLKIYFKSPFKLKPPAAGIVIYNALGTPIFTTNPRMHYYNFIRKDLSEGIAKLIIQDLPLLSGSYKISFWLGDEQQDYDHIKDGITFDFISKRTYTKVPDVSVVGSIDINANWVIEENS